MPFKSEKQRKWMWANDPEMAQEWENEEKLEEEEKETINPKMRKRDLVEYIKTSIIKEQNPPRYGGGDPYNFPFLREITHQERRDIMKYYETLRQSGIVNMFGSSSILNWTRDDLSKDFYTGKEMTQTLLREKLRKRNMTMKMGKTIIPFQY